MERCGAWGAAEHPPARTVPADPRALLKSHVEKLLRILVRCVTFEIQL